MQIVLGKLVLALGFELEDEGVEVGFPDGVDVGQDVSDEGRVEARARHAPLVRLVPLRHLPTQQFYVFVRQFM